MESNVVTSEDVVKAYHSFQHYEENVEQEEEEDSEDTSVDTDTQMQAPLPPMGKKRMSKAERKKIKKLNKAEQNEKLPLQSCCLKAVHNWTQELQELRKQLGEMEKRYNLEKRLREECEQKMETMMQNNPDGWTQQHNHDELAWRRVKGLDKIISELVVDLKFADEQIHQMLADFVQFYQVRAAASQAAQAAAAIAGNQGSNDFAPWYQSQDIQHFQNSNVQHLEQIAAPIIEPELRFHADQREPYSDILISMQNLQIGQGQTDPAAMLTAPTTTSGNSGDSDNDSEFADFPGMSYHIRFIERLLESPSDHMFDSEETSCNAGVGTAAAAEEWESGC